MENYFVSLSGSDDNPGNSIDRPFATITKGISMLEAGDVLNLREGNYVESVVIVGKHGTPGHPIVIRSFPGEHATIDGCLPQFCSANNDEWEPAILHDPKAHADEFVSCECFDMDGNQDRVNRGAFLDLEPYTRLITYSHLKDLRAAYQTFPTLPLSDKREGNEIVDKFGEPTGVKKPWVYMGPGLFYERFCDPETGLPLNTGRIHIRLSHTTNNVNGILDYKGETDPRKVRLAISHKSRTTLTVKNSKFIRFENLSIRFGGEDTIHFKITTGIVLDHVRILAGSHGARLEGNDGLVFSHCEIRGGMPGWYFRTDRKDEYRFKEGDTVDVNNLGKQTCRALFVGGDGNSGLELHHCEFLDAHDLHIFGVNTRFHHNWINNLNDEGLIINAAPGGDLHIFQNVITQCLSAISMSGRTNSGGTYIYRNLIDLRQPTAGFRPKTENPEPLEVFRFGHLYKSTGGDGPLHLFQNTCLVTRQRGQASYLHYKNTEGIHCRRSFNNIFIAVNPEPDFERVISFVPSPSFEGPTDGNCYFRIGNTLNKNLFVYLKYDFQGQSFKGGKFKDLDALRASELFVQSKTQYPPGYEACSIDKDPKFRRIGGDANSPFNSDDLRLRNDSSARGQGIILPSKLKDFDPVQVEGCPDIGCYQGDDPGLHVGVDGRRHFPISPGDIVKT